MKAFADDKMSYVATKIGWVFERVECNVGKGRDAVP